MPRRVFTVIIPTRERCDTLKASLKTVTQQDYDSLEIIVSDNFSQDDTAEVVQSFNDPRIVYCNTGRRLSMSENWEFALSHVSGEWLTIIGDDDALLPDCFDFVNSIIDETNTLAIRTATCGYLWPANSEREGKLSVPMTSGIETRDTRQWLDKVLRGAVPYYCLPMLYNGGFVSMQAIEAGKRGGRFYRSCIPDVYSAMLLSRTLGDYVYSHRPLAINGASKHSTGTAQFSKKSGNSAPAERFLTEGNLPFHESIPLTDTGDYPKSLTALVYESYAQVSEIIPDRDGLTPFEQLRTILATAGAHRESLSSWINKFSEMHGLDLSKAELESQVIIAEKRRGKLLRNIELLKDTIVSTGGKNPIRDVYQASQLADSLLRNPQHIAYRVASRLGGIVSRRLFGATSP